MLGPERIFGSFVGKKCRSESKSTKENHIEGENQRTNNEIRVQDGDVISSRRAADSQVLRNEIRDGRDDSNRPKA